MAKKEAKDLTIDDIEKELKKLKSEERKTYLKSILDGVSPDLKSNVKKFIAREIKDNPTTQYYLAYDSISEGLEPIYFWILDFMRDTSPSGLGLDVKKGTELIEASVSSGYYGDIGQRVTLMQQKAAEMLKQVNGIVRSILNLVYDLKEFQMRIDTYNEAKSPDNEVKEAAELALKTVWMDQVDIKKGVASINQMAQKLNFITLRDAFMSVNTESEANKLDVNDRVRRIVLRKVSEFKKWRDYSEKEIRKRYSIERTYMKSQIDSLKLYTKWAKPYLKAAQKLAMHEFNMPDIVSAFSNMQLELSLIGKKEIKPESVHESFKDLKMEKKYYAVIMVELKFRSVPQTYRTQSGQQYVHGGRADLYFKAYAVDDKDLELLDDIELYEDMDLVENLTNVSLKELEEDIAELLKEETQEVKKKIKKPETIKEIKEGFKEIIDPLKDVFKFAMPSQYAAAEIKKAAKEKAESTCFAVYDVYKKAHGMFTWG